MAVYLGAFVDRNGEIIMEIKVLQETGYEQALLGMSLSYYDHATPIYEWWDEDKRDRAKKRSLALAFKGGGHNKFLESIQVWIFIKASRDFWVDFDTYRVGITKQSASTMHTLDKRSVTVDDFEEGTEKMAINAFNYALARYKDSDDVAYKDITRLKKNLPEGWLQERIVCTNYKTLQNIIYQRKGHRLRHFTQLIEAILAQVEHPELLSVDADKKSCKKCQGAMIPSKAIEQTYTGMPDFIGDKYPVTLSAGGPGKLVDCFKCRECGWSVS